MWVSGQGRPFPGAPHLSQTNINCSSSTNLDLGLQHGVAKLRTVVLSLLGRQK